jgi:hypothetical protein
VRVSLERPDAVVQITFHSSLFAFYVNRSDVAIRISNSDAKNVTGRFGQVFPINSTIILCFPFPSLHPPTKLSDLWPRRKTVDRSAMFNQFDVIDEFLDDERSNDGRRDLRLVPSGFGSNTGNQRHTVISLLPGSAIPSVLGTQ